MSTRAVRVACSIVAMFAVTGSAQQPATAPAFRYERPILTGGAGPRRLAIDVPLLVGAAPFRVTTRAIDAITRRPLLGVGGGLTDLRIYDANGAEVGYLLEEPAQTR